MTPPKFKAVVLNEADGALTMQFFKETALVSTEVVKPQDKNGLDHFLAQRLETLETADALKSGGIVGREFTLKGIREPVDSDPERTLWFSKLNRLVRIKEYAIKHGILTGDEKEITDLVADLKATYLPVYIATF